MTRDDLTFVSDGVSCQAWHYRAESDALATAAGTPCAVMAHGFGGTRDSGLEPFAEALAGAGLDAILFDYRGFGSSGGEPRQVVDVKHQLADYRAAVTAARGLDGVDPDRIVVWGTSLSGGHTLALAAEDSRLGAAVAMTPAADGRAAVREIVRRDGVKEMFRAMPMAVRDLIAGFRNRDPLLLPIVGRPGDLAGLTAPGALESYTAIAGPTWRNEFAARAFLKVGSYRPGTTTSDITCPLLVQVADDDRTAPPEAATAAASQARRAEVRHYPCDHFDVYPGQDWHDTAVTHQVEFLTRHLSTGANEGAP